MRLDAGDVFSLSTPGGGGIGDPCSRPAQDVLRDVVQGKVSVAAARESYGVVITNNIVDATATEDLRASMPAPRRYRLDGWPDTIDTGPGRAEYERIFGGDVSDFVVRTLFEVPPAARYYAKQRWFQRMKQTGEPISVETAKLIWRELQPAIGLRTADANPP